MRPHDGGVEHLNQVRGAAGCSKRVEEGLKHAGSAEAPEALPDGIPVPELGRERPPVDVVQREVVERFEEPTVVPAFVASARAHGPKHLNHHLPVLVRHPRQHGRPPQTDQPGSTNPERGKSGQRRCSFQAVHTA
jgi:hypothetical protein